MKKIILLISLVFALVCFTYTMQKPVITENDIGLTANISISPVICDVFNQVAVSSPEPVTDQITDTEQYNGCIFYALLNNVELWTYDTNTSIRLALYNKENPITRYIPRPILTLHQLHHDPGDIMI